MHLVNNRKNGYIWIASFLKTGHAVCTSLHSPQPHLLCAQELATDLAPLALWAPTRLGLRSPGVGPALTSHPVHHLHGFPKQLLCLRLDFEDAGALLPQSGALAQPVLQLCILSLYSLKPLKKGTMVSVTINIQSPKDLCLDHLMSPKSTPRGKIPTTSYPQWIGFAYKKK